jgi:hypothetical protein
MTRRFPAAPVVKALVSAAFVCGMAGLAFYPGRTPADAPSSGAKTAPAKAVGSSHRVVPAPAKSAAPEPVEPADNSYCMVCHLNYENEKLTKSHQPAGIGCEKCHGMSAKHSADEDGLTPPDIMYPQTEVNRFCLSCHGKEKERLLKETAKEHKEFFAKTAAELFCTDCHGEHHRLKHRTRVWDKTTRKLVRDDGVRMMYKDSPATTGKAAPAKQAPQAPPPAKAEPEKTLPKKL